MRKYILILVLLCICTTTFANDSHTASSPVFGRKKVVNHPVKNRRSAGITENSIIISPVFLPIMFVGPYLDLRAHFERRLFGNTSIVAGPSYNSFSCETGDCRAQGKGTTWGVDLYIRQYFETGVTLFGQLGIDALKASVENSRNHLSASGYSVDPRFICGLRLGIGKSFFFEPGIGLIYHTTEIATKSRTNLYGEEEEGYGVRTGPLLSLHLGLVYSF